MPGQDDGTKSHIGAEVPTNHKQALNQIAHERSNPNDRVYLSDVVREAVRQYLRRRVEADDLSGETLDLLDDDLVANAGGGDLEVTEA